MKSKFALLLIGILMFTACTSDNNGSYKSASYNASADEGGTTNVGGGGDDMIADFSAKAAHVVEAYSGFTQDERGLLRESLKCKVTTVAVLIDGDGQPVKNQETLVAWGLPGSIQLKTGEQGDSWEKLFKEKRILVHHIVHELYRCSDREKYKAIHDFYWKGKRTYETTEAPDEGYALSVDVHELQDKDKYHLMAGSEAIASFNCRVLAWVGPNFFDIPGTEHTIAVTPGELKTGPVKGMTNFKTGRLEFSFVPQKTNQGIMISYAELRLSSADPSQKDDGKGDSDLVLPDDMNEYDLTVELRENKVKARDLGLKEHEDEDVQSVILMCRP
jgi:hypothetical protein